MRTIGLVGGMSWESRPVLSDDQPGYRERLGALHSAKIASTASTSTRSNNGSTPGNGKRRARFWRMPRGPSTAPVPTSSSCARTRCTRWRRRSRRPSTSRSAHRGRDGCAREGRRHRPRRPARNPVHDGGGLLPRRLESRHGLTVLTPPAGQRALVHGVIYGSCAWARSAGSRARRSSRSSTAWWPAARKA